MYTVCVRECYSPEGFFTSTKLMEKKIGKHAVRRGETCFPVRTVGGKSVSPPPGGYNNF